MPFSKSKVTNFKEISNSITYTKLPLATSNEIEFFMLHQRMNWIHLIKGKFLLLGGKNWNFFSHPNINWKVKCWVSIAIFPHSNTKISWMNFIILTFLTKVQRWKSKKTFWSKLPRCISKNWTAIAESRWLLFFCNIKKNDFE